MRMAWASIIWPLRSMQPHPMSEVCVVPPISGKPSRYENQSLDLTSSIRLLMWSGGASDVGLVGSTAGPSAGGGREYFSPSIQMVSPCENFVLNMGACSALWRYVLKRLPHPAFGGVAAAAAAASGGRMLWWRWWWWWWWLWLWLLWWLWWWWWSPASLWLKRRRRGRRQRRGSGHSAHSRGCRSSVPGRTPAGTLPRSTDSWSIREGTDQMQTSVTRGKRRSTGCSTAPLCLSTRGRTRACSTGTHPPGRRRWSGPASPGSGTDPRCSLLCRGTRRSTRLRTRRPLSTRGRGPCGSTRTQRGRALCWGPRSAASPCCSPSTRGAGQHTPKGRLLSCHSRGKRRRTRCTCPCPSETQRLGTAR
mmetsp:Transcript_14113/g.36425  ORF Transcript_14113/g.36425 Transcript_14113/m.36425 type:complete len:363 (+) Transcript_14113:239-1327(+)